MNIFYLDSDPKLAAEYHCDKHCVKMVLETAQLLSTALQLNGANDNQLYKITHKNHPSAIWVRSTREQYNWTVDLFESLLKEYELRYNKIHKCSSMIGLFDIYAKRIRGSGYTAPPQCMPDDCKGDNTVEAYRNYYRVHKAYMATWKTQTPDWF